jgi:hypothetical protein
MIDAGRTVIKTAGMQSWSMSLLRLKLQRWCVPLQQADGVHESEYEHAPHIIL